MFVVEGEKDADALVAAGVVATCNIEGAAKPGQTLKWRKDYTEQLRGAMVTVVADKDNNDTGMAHATHIVNELTGVAAPVRLVEPLEGKDAYDHLQAGWQVRDFVEVFDQLQVNDPPIPLNVAAAIGQIYAGVTPQSAAQANLCTVEEITHALTLPAAKLIEPTSEWDAVDLLAAEFRDTPDILAGAIPVGLTLISAAPKVGKTRFLAQVSVAAVRGSAFLNRVVTQTKVLTLALEDGARRYRKSLHYLVGTNWPGRSELTVRTTSARLDEGGLTQIEQHLDKHPDCGLIIIDVLARVRPRGRGTDKYQLDYDALASLQRMANLRHMAIVVVHHTNQRADVTDIYELVSGTSGLIGVVDSLMVLQRRRSDDVGLLHITGREVEDQTIALSFTDGWWRPAPEDMPADLLTECKEVRELWLWLASDEGDGVSTEVLAKAYGRTKDTTLKLLHRLEEKELVDSLGKAAPGKPVCWQVVRRRYSRSGSSDSYVAFELSDSSLSTLNAGNTGNGGIEGDGGIVRREIDRKRHCSLPTSTNLQSKPSGQRGRIGDHRPVAHSR